MPVIEVTNLVRRFGSITAVNDISFTVEPGTIFGFLGPNGAGKTTTINILCTLLSPTSGHTVIDGHDCIRDSSRVRESIGIVFQDTTLDKDLTAYENLAFHAMLYGVHRSEIKKRVNEALRFVDLFDRQKDLVKKFSGGMKRRLEVARGLIHRPKVLFLDEPTLGLDPQSRANLWEFITRLPKEHGVTVFMTTHYMEEAEVCDKIAIIDHGRIIAEGTPEELKAIVGGDVIYIKARDNDSALRLLTDTLGIESEIKNGEILVTACEGETCIPRILSTLSGEILSIRLEKPSLNSVFLKLTGTAIRAEEGSAADTIRGEIRAHKRRHGRG